MKTFAKKLPTSLNEIVETDEYFVSYVADTAANPAVAMLDMLLGVARGTETALVENKNGRRGRCLILTGDHREAFLKVVNEGGDYEAAVALYKKLAAEGLRGPTSEDDFPDELYAAADTETGDDPDTDPGTANNFEVN